MGKKIKSFWHVIARNKYLCVIIIFIVVAGFLDANSFWARYQLHKENEALRSEIKRFEEQFACDKKQLNSLKNDPEAVERVARMSLKMSKPNEDVYVFE